MRRPYTRSLDPQDYEFLPQAADLLKFEREMKAQHVRWHEHKIWENASILLQLEELSVPKSAKMIDIGSGGTFFPVYLSSVAGYADVSLTDSMFAMRHAAMEAMIQQQRKEFGVSLPLYNLPAEDMHVLESESFDVVMCISTIEHIDADKHDAALREMHRITKPDGLIFITSDYFRSIDGGPDQSQHHASPYRDGQFTAYHKELVLNLPNVIEVDFIGDTDLDYRGDFVNNYSFVNVCMRKRAASTPATAGDNGKAPNV